MKNLEVEVVASDVVSGQVHEIRLSIDGDQDGQASDLDHFLP